MEYIWVAATLNEMKSVFIEAKFGLNVRPLPRVRVKIDCEVSIKTINIVKPRTGCVHYPYRIAKIAS